MRSPVTIADVARLAGVSTVTVSKTLNNTGRISEETRARVIKAAGDLGYVANPAARRRLRGALDAVKVGEHGAYVGCVCGDGG